MQKISYIKLMADYCSTGLWSKDGTVLELADLPISPELGTAITKWVQWYDVHNKDYLPLDERAEFPLQDFSNVGKELATKLKTEMPQTQVFYFDEAAWDHAFLTKGANATKIQSDYLYEI